MTDIEGWEITEKIVFIILLSAICIKVDLHFLYFAYFIVFCIYRYNKRKEERNKEVE